MYTKSFKNISTQHKRITKFLVTSWTCHVPNINFLDLIWPLHFCINLSFHLQLEHDSSKDHSKRVEWKLKRRRNQSLISTLKPSYYKPLHDGRQETLFSCCDHTHIVHWHVLAFQGRIRWWYEYICVRLLQTSYCNNLLSSHSFLPRMVWI